MITKAEKGRNETSKYLKKKSYFCDNVDINLHVSFDRKEVKKKVQKL